MESLHLRFQEGNTMTLITSTTISLQLLFFSPPLSPSRREYDDVNYKLVAPKIDFSIAFYNISKQNGIIFRKLTPLLIGVGGLYFEFFYFPF